jgi:hypothetical protein
MKRCLQLALAAALAGCGGAISTTGTSGTTTADLAANAPTYDKLALSQSEADLVMPPEHSSGDSAVAPEQAAASEPCHPHLFGRSHEILGRMNRHFAKHLRHIEELIKSTPTLEKGGTATWETVKDGIDRKLTITGAVNADKSVTYAFDLEMKSTGAFVKVMDGSLTHKGPATPDKTTAIENSGVANFDFTALHSVIPKEKATGKVSDAFDNVHDPVKGEKRVATVTLTAFLPEEGDKHGPRTGKYIWEGEHGIGGSFVFEDTVVLCATNAASTPSDLVAVSRWYKADDGALHGRTDAKASGGSIPTGDTWMGATCAQGSTKTTPGEGFWMIKLENASGATVQGQAAVVGATPCDTALGGPAPDLTSNAHDFNFATVDFSAPYPFPHQW